MSSLKVGTIRLKSPKTETIQYETASNYTEYSVDEGVYNVYFEMHAGEPRLFWRATGTVTLDHVENSLFASKNVHDDFNEDKRKKVSHYALISPLMISNDISNEDFVKITENLDIDIDAPWINIDKELIYIEGREKPYETYRFNIDLNNKDYVNHRINEDVKNKIEIMKFTPSSFTYTNEYAEKKGFYDTDKFKEFIYGEHTDPIRKIVDYQYLIQLSYTLSEEYLADYEFLSFPVDYMERPHDNGSQAIESIHKLAKEINLKNIENRKEFLNSL